MTCEPDVLEYDNYRLYLKDHFEHRRSTRYGSSLRQFAASSGFSSNAFLTQILKGTRNLSAESTEKLIIGLGLTGSKAAYFRALVFFNQAKKADLKQHYLNELKELRNQSLFHKVRPGQFDYYKYWYLPVLLELAVSVPFKGNYAKLGALVRPCLTKKEVQEGLEILERIHLLKKEDSGKYTRMNTLISGENIPGVIVRTIRSEMLLRALEASDSVPKDQCHLAYSIFGTTEEKFKQVTEKMDAYRKEIINLLLEEEETDKVFCMQFNAFPLTNSIARFK